MKKCCILLFLAVFLCGCSAEQTFERVYDELLLPVMAPMGELQLQLPPDATQTVLANDAGGKLYFCDGYSLAVQTMEAGDLDKTLRSLCGYGEEALTVLETKVGNVDRFDWVFSCMGESGSQVGRGAVLDDGHYHYCVTVMADEAISGSLDARWDALFSSLSLKA